jgi:hypothetical protein
MTYDETVPRPYPCAFPSHRMRIPPPPKHGRHQRPPARRIRSQLTARPVSRSFSTGHTRNDPSVGPGTASLVLRSSCNPSASMSRRLNRQPLQTYHRRYRNDETIATSYPVAATIGRPCRSKRERSFRFLGGTHAQSCRIPQPCPIFGLVPRIHASITPNRIRIQDNSISVRSILPAPTMARSQGGESTYVFQCLRPAFPAAQA